MINPHLNAFRDALDWTSFHPNEVVAVLAVASAIVYTWGQVLLMHKDIEDERRRQ